MFALLFVASSKASAAAKWESGAPAVSAARTGRPHNMTAAATITIMPRIIVPSSEMRDLNLIFFDDRVGEQFFAHLLQAGARVRLVSLAKLDVDHLALAHFADRVETEIVERMPDRLALRIKHTVFQCYK